VPVDFIAVAEDAGGNRAQQHMLLANCFAQAEALMQGQTSQEAGAGLGKADASLAAHKTFPGDRPSTLLLLDRLDAGTLGMLIALYEHRTFVQACIWDINPFDQMGVELGKRLAERVLKALDSGDPSILRDAASRAAVTRVLKTK
jgi:glucose-6-phosphate isomerase